MRFKTQLGLHPAWQNSIHIPASLLAHYQALGLDGGSLIYVLQIIAAYWRGDEASHERIAQVMGIQPRALRRYNADLEAKGLITINGRYLHGNRLENDYDLTPLLDASALLDQTTQQQQATAEKNAYRIVQSLVNALEQGDDVTGLLLDLVGKWKSINGEPTGHLDPVETGHLDPVETGHLDPVETGHLDPVETGHLDPVSIGHPDPLATSGSLPVTNDRLKPVTNDRGLSVVSPQQESLKETTTTDNQLVMQLHAVGFTNGDANKAILTAVEKFGGDGPAVIAGWLAYVGTQANLRNPAGLIRKRIREGERPPALPLPPAPANVQTATAVAPILREI